MRAVMEKFRLLIKIGCVVLIAFYYEERTIANR